MKRLWVVVGLLCSVCQAGERVSVVVPTEEERQVEALLDRLKDAVNNEDAKAYLACLTKPLANKRKKDVVVRFMKHNMEMEIEKSEIMESSDATVTFVARYIVYEDGRPHQIVSSVIAKRDGDSLLVSKEEVLSTSSRGRDELAASNRGDAVGAVGLNPCANGQCPLPPQKGPKDGGRIFPEGISLFNDEHGNPDPNGIMWLDPKKLLAKFPDKYGVPPCMREQLAKEAGLK